VKKQANKSVGAFNQDAIEHQGYLYSTNAPLSSQIANKRLSDLTLENVDLQGKTVLDIGCGDGVYTIELFDKIRVKSMLGVDYAAQAVEIAKAKSGARPIKYEVQSAYSLPYATKSFDVALLRGVLHHLDDPIPALKEALRVAAIVWVIEPNGYNPGLKFLEKFSRYHIEHQEKSYSPAYLDREIAKLGGKVLRRKWAGFVPMFCPEWMAKTMKVIEPLIEAVPVLKHLGCSVYVFSASDTLREA
jgi:ubiquinone/menaquinone biosynthesis C-methylase UbiE